MCSRKSSILWSIIGLENVHLFLRMSYDLYMTISNDFSTKPIRFNPIVLMHLNVIRLDYPGIRYYRGNWRLDWPFLVESSDPTRGIYCSGSSCVEGDFVLRSSYARHENLVEEVNSKISWHMWSQYQPVPQRPRARIYCSYDAWPCQREGKNSCFWIRFVTFRSWMEITLLGGERRTTRTRSSPYSIAVERFIW